MYSLTPISSTILIVPSDFWLGCLASRQDSLTTISSDKSRFPNTAVFQFHHVLPQSVLILHLRLHVSLVLLRTVGHSFTGPSYGPPTAPNPVGKPADLLFFERRLNIYLIFYTVFRLTITGYLSPDCTHFHFVKASTCPVTPRFVVGDPRITRPHT